MRDEKSILIPLFYDYYMFDYFRFLIPQLLEDGFRVTVVTFRSEVEKKYSVTHSRFQVRYGPFLVRACLAFSGKFLWRVALWMIAWAWGLQLRRRYDFAILPWDNKPLWYVISCLIPSMTCHNSTELIDVETTLQRDRLVLKTRAQRSIHRFFCLLDLLWQRKFFPRLQGEILKYKPHILLADRLMGFRSPNYHGGFSKVKT